MVKKRHDFNPKEFDLISQDKNIAQAKGGIISFQKKRPTNKVGRYRSKGASVNLTLTNYSGSSLNTVRLHRITSFSGHPYKTPMCFPVKHIG
jgi:hypothetical protein